MSSFLHLLPLKLPLDVRERWANHRGREHGLKLSGNRLYLAVYGADPPAGLHWGAGEAEGVGGAVGGGELLVVRLLSVAEGETTR